MPHERHTWWRVQDELNFRLWRIVKRTTGSECGLLEKTCRSHLCCRLNTAADLSEVTFCRSWRCSFIFGCDICVWLLQFGIDWSSPLNFLQFSPHHFRFHHSAFISIIMWTKGSEAVTDRLNPAMFVWATVHINTASALGFRALVLQCVLWWRTWTCV